MSPRTLSTVLPVEALVLCWPAQAFVKLEALPSIPKERREAFADLALSIFVAHPPADPRNLAEGRERQRTAAAGGGKGQLDVLLDDLVADKDQVGGPTQISFSVVSLQRVGTDEGKGLVKSTYKAIGD
eukprot:GHRQ01019201.1.p1 GENE.GHRQ01019201.1~~GHRQ01019201.1.p1  ORF type:complete len:128 (+),score=33.90 GHRQ01019201.1:27-410(+)